MKFTPSDPPRLFNVGQEAIIKLKDCGRIELLPDEQVTFTTESGGEYDVVRKSWGFYATPSVNRRLPTFGLYAAIVKSPGGRTYLWLVEKGKEKEFQAYAALERQKVICWLDTDEKIEALEVLLSDMGEGERAKEAAAIATKPPF